MNDTKIIKVHSKIQQNINKSPPLQINLKEWRLIILYAFVLVVTEIIIELPAFLMKLTLNAINFNYQFIGLNFIYSIPKINFIVPSITKNKVNGNVKNIIPIVALIISIIPRIPTSLP